MTLPDQLDTVLHASVALLERSLQVASVVAKTHDTTIVTGWQGSPQVIDAVGAYLVGLLATSVSRALRVRSFLADTMDDRLELEANVNKKVGPHLTEQQKQDERNPWIAEGLWHLCLLLSSRRPDLHPHGSVIAIDLPHIGAKDHGFDVVALYRASDGIGLSIVECKAYENNPNKAINDAVGFYKKFDTGEFDPRARQVVASMRDALPAADQALVSASLWKDRRVYVPNPHYDSSHKMNWSITRSSFKELRIGPRHIAIMPHAIHGFSKFFDDVSTSMINTVSRLPSV